MIKIEIEKTDTLHTKFGTAKINKNNGYYQINSAKEGNHKKYLHRLMFADFYGPFPQESIIHHKNGDKTSNCVLNLQIMKNSEHTSLHNKGKRKGKNNHQWKDYARILKNGLNSSGKPVYLIRYNGENIKSSIDKEKLEKSVEKINNEGCDINEI